MTKRPSDSELIKLLVDTDVIIRNVTNYRAGPISKKSMGSDSIDFINLRGQSPLSIAGVG